jgi:hypothetical protein
LIGLFYSTIIYQNAVLVNRFFNSLLEKDFSNL